jgi:hypothetical protein
MEFGIQFFPCVGPRDVPAAKYFADVLALSELADELGYHHVRMVEHYFHPYGGYSPNPLLFLAAARRGATNETHPADHRRRVADFQQLAQTRRRNRHG